VGDVLPFVSGMVWCLSPLISSFAFADLRAKAAEVASQLESVQVAYSSAQQELEVLDAAAREVCEEFEQSGGGQGASSTVSRLRSLSRLLVDRVRGGFRFGIKKCLSVMSTHFVFQTRPLVQGYIVSPDLDDTAVLALIKEKDDAVEEVAAALAKKLDGELFPDAEEDEGDAQDDAQGDEPRDDEPQGGEPQDDEPQDPPANA
jgi:hypothetical protein